MPLQELKNFEVIEGIGSGSFGECKKVRRLSDGKIFAWKQIDYSLMREKEKRMLTNEVHALRNLRNPYILTYIGEIVDSANKILYIVTEYCVGGDLLSLINKLKKKGANFSEDFIWKVLCQLLFALWECHDITNRGTIILHRDVKPANVFLTENKDMKLGDFGMARLLPSESAFASSYSGSPAYMSPEIVANRNYNDKSDIWGLGCLIYHLCALTPPFYATDLSSLARKILEGKFNRIPTMYSNELEDVIRKMLTLQADKRPSAEVIINLPVVTARCKQLNLRLTQGKENELAKKEKMLLQQERELQMKGKKLEKQEIWLNLQAKLLEERTMSIEQYANVIQHLGLHQKVPTRELRNTLQAKKLDSMASSSQSSSNCSSNVLKHFKTSESLSMSSTNGRRNTLKHVHFQDTAHPDKVKIQEKPYLEDAKRMPAIRSTKKEDFLSVANGPSVKQFQELKSSLKLANRRALKLRMAEMETRMILSPFI